MDPLPFLIIAIVLFTYLQVTACLVWRSIHNKQLRSSVGDNAMSYIFDKKPKISRKKTK